MNDQPDRNLFKSPLVTTASTVPRLPLSSPPREIHPLSIGLLAASPAPMFPIIRGEGSVGQSVSGPKESCLSLSLPSSQS